MNELWEKLPELAAKAGYEAGGRHLAEGRPICYSEDDYLGEIIKHYPDGHREIVCRKRSKDEEMKMRATVKGKRFGGHNLGKGEEEIV